MSLRDEGFAAEGAVKPLLSPDDVQRLISAALCPRRRRRNRYCHRRNPSPVHPLLMQLQRRVCVDHFVAETAPIRADLKMSTHVLHKEAHVAELQRNDI
jgi:hypothetical protein